MKWQFENETVLEVLHKGSWFAGRSIAKETLNSTLVKTNQPILEKVVEFLESFYGLKFIFYNRQNGIMDDFNFDVLRAYELLSPGWMEDGYIPRIGKQACLIGTAYREHFVLLMDSEGIVYGACDDLLVKIANSGKAAIEAIVLNYEFDEELS